MDVQFISEYSSSFEILRDYYKRYKPNEYLFEGQNGGKYSNEIAGQVYCLCSRLLPPFRSLGINC